MNAIQIELIELEDEGWKLYPVLIKSEQHTILIDTGLPNNQTELIEKLGRLGVLPNQIDVVILTHQDLDHIGNARYFSTFGAKIYASKLDKPYIEGEKELIKYTILEQKVDKDEEEIVILNKIKSYINEVHVKVDYILEDQMILDLAGGLKVIDTSGHTPGHISIYSLMTDTLISGDALEIEEGKLVAPNLILCSNKEDAMRSYQRIKDLHVSQVIAYHFGQFNLCK